MKKLFFFTLVILFSLTTIVVNAQDKKTLNNNQKNPTAKEQIDISKLPPKIPVNSISSPYIHESQTDVVSGIAFTQTTGTYTAIAGTQIHPDKQPGEIARSAAPSCSGRHPQ